MIFKTNLKASQSIIDLTPLVDVVFLLLVFFVITSDILPLKSLNVDNPALNRNSPPMTTQFLVMMDAHHVIYLGTKKEIVELPAVKEQLLEQIAKAKSNNPATDPTIVLSVDKRVDYGSFLKLFSLVQQTGHKVRLVYKPLERGVADHWDPVASGIKTYK